MTSDEERRDNIIRKIKGCLARSESSNQYEAIVSITKARELMAQYKIKELELGGEDREVVAEYTDVNYTKRYSCWIEAITQVVAKNNRCQSYQQKGVGGQRTRMGVLLGFKTDVFTTKEIISFIVMFVKGRIAAEDLDWIEAINYGYGFARGLEQAYLEQNQYDKTTALVMVIPEEVKTAYRELKLGAAQKARYEIDDNYKNGVKEGLNYLKPKIGGKNEPKIT